MIVYPNSKINLGLHVTEKRSDGYHNIETVFYPIRWCDALEIIPAGEEPFDFSHSGLDISGNQETNLIYKAWLILNQKKGLPPLKVHLHKHIPMGAGLGGGSSDAAWFINTCNEQFQLGLYEEERLAMASQLGSDCAFFIKNRPLMARGKGDEFSPIQVDLSTYYLLTVYPNVHSNTALAYKNLTPKAPKYQLKTILETIPVNEWQGVLVNDFEPSVFAKYPEIETLKKKMMNMGSVYCSMSGSGSAVYALYTSPPDVTQIHSNPYCLQNPE